MSTATVFEVEGRMIAQNDTLDEAVHPRANFFSGLPTSPGLPENSNFLAFLWENWTFLVSLTIYIDVEESKLEYTGPHSISRCPD